MTALKTIKSYGLEDALEVEILTSVKERTLYNWFNNYPRRFECMVMAAATIKKRLGVSCKDLERKKLEVLTEQFLENGGAIEVIDNVIQNVPPKIKTSERGGMMND